MAPEQYLSTIMVKKSLLEGHWNTSRTHGQKGQSVQ
jgi:hypothetical protein